MRVVAAAIILSFVGFSADAADACKVQAAEKKLAKCEKDAATACDVSAKEKKLAGAAKTSFTKKCVSDAIGT